jgi:hypothetical protein
MWRPRRLLVWMRWMGIGMGGQRCTTTEDGAAVAVEAVDVGRRFMTTAALMVGRARGADGVDMKATVLSAALRAAAPLEGASLARFPFSSRLLKKLPRGLGVGVSVEKIGRIAPWTLVAERRFRADQYVDQWPVRTMFLPWVVRGGSSLCSPFWFSPLPLSEMAMGGLSLSLQSLLLRIEVSRGLGSVCNKGKDW